MAKLQHTFVQGKMNKDLDERLVPNGQYRDAKNIQVSTSEGSDVGAIENILGNTIQNLGAEVQAWEPGFGLSNTTCIGAIRDSQNEKIYWFITSDTVDAILEYDQATSVVAPVLVDTNNILNFSTSNLITGVNILEGMLFWTDDNSEPKKIEIARFKAGSLQGQGEDTLVVHTQVYGSPFVESDITVIKPSPKQAIDIIAKSTKTNANPERGVGITPVSVLLKLTDANGYALSTGNTVVSTGTIAPFIAPSSVFNNKDVRLSHTALRSDGTKIKYEAVATMSLLTAGEVPGQFNGATFTIKSVSSNVPNAALQWDLLLIESEPIFKNDFARFSYRWKYVDGEYSTYAPFSTAAFIAGGYEYEPENGYNLGMNDNIRKITLNFPTSTYALPPGDVEEIEILYKGVGSNNIYVLDTHLTANGALATFDIDKKLLGPVIESLQLLRLYDDVPRKAKSQEIIGNRVVYGNYLHNYTLGNTASITASTTGTAFSTVQKYYGQASVKSERTYQIGVSFLDKYNRESPVFTNKEAAIEVALEDANKINKISAITAMTSVPSWAEYYKYYVKDPSAEYYNIILDRFYDAQDGNIWLSFPSAERNKVSEGEFLTLKKAHGSNDNIFIDNKYKIIDIKNEAPDFVKKVNKAVARVEINVATATDFQGKRLNFDGPTPSTHEFFVSELQGGASVQFRTLSGDKTSDIYLINSGGSYGDVAQGSGEKKYHIQLAEDGFTADDVWLTNLSPNTKLEIIVYATSNDLLPEFQGKFFVKVGKSASFENDIAARIGLSQYVTTLRKANVEDDLNTVSRNVFNARMAFGLTFNTLNYPINYPADTTTTFDLNVYTGWYDQDDQSNFRDLQGGEALKIFNQINLGSRVRFKNANGDVGKVYNVTNVATSAQIIEDDNGYDFTFERKVITVDRAFSDNLGSNPSELEIQLVEAIKGSINATTNPAIFETEPLELADVDIYYEATDALEISGLTTNTVDLDFKNCYSFGNGVESNRIRDDFNAPLLSKGVRVSTVLSQPYGAERKGNGLIFSGIVNSISGINNSNQFTTAINITKDLPNTYGSIQKLHARDTDLIALCEDKCFRILANKDALFNADGNTNVTSNTNVLGQTIPYVGEFGISKNPESFAMYGFRAYFTDKARGAVIRLSRDGITEISSNGMTDYFEDKLKLATGALIGSYDEQASSYNIKIGNEQTSFKEGVGGWSTRLSYAPEFAISLNNDYYSFKDGEIWEHTNNTRANFFGVQENTTVTTIFNDAPTSVKNFKTLSYEGDAGWTASITTNKQSGSVSNWKEREGIYFNYIKGEATTLGNIDTSKFSVQGIGDVYYAVDGVGYYDLSFTSAINTSLQVGDVIYFVDVSAGNALKLLGDVLSVTGLTVRAEWDDTAANEPQDGDFILFAKNGNVNTSGLIGYYAEAEFTSTGGTKKELFAVNSEIFISSE